MKKLKFVIIGAGIGGLSVAIGLKKLGHDVIILEKAKNYSEINTGLCLWSFAVSYLINLGIKEKELDKIGAKHLHFIMKTSKNKIIMDEDMTGINKKVIFPNYEIHRSKLQKLLGKTLGEENILFNQKIISIDENSNKKGNHINAICENGNKYSADIIIGADGAFSKVRDYVLKKEVKVFNHNIAIRGVCKISTDIIPLNTHIRIMGMNNLFGVARISKTHVRWYAQANKINKDYSPIVLKNKLINYYSNWPDEVKHTLNNTDLKNLIAKRIVNIKPIEKWTRNRVILLGDSAHAIKPTIALGAGTAIGDAHYLVKLFSKKEGLKNKDIDSILKKYESKRKKVAKKVYNETEDTDKFIFKNNYFSAIIRNFLFKIAPADKMEELTINRMKGYE